VTTQFAGNAEIATGGAPFFAVRGNTPPIFCSKLREEVRQLMTQCSIDLSESMFVEPRIQ
jgi:hypothetical protein